jgi:transposase IS66 family protein
VLRGPATAYTINEVAVAYWQRQGLAQTMADALQTGPCQFADDAAWQARLQELGISAERPVRIATEGALLGQVIAQGVAPDLVILSDGAEPFNLLAQAACWVPAERPLVRLIPYHEAHRAAIAGVRQQIWELYRALQAYRAQPDPAQKAVLESRFDRLGAPRTVYPSINQVLKEMRQHKADLLRVLACPAVPLHNNGTESIIRVYVQKRKISGSTRSPSGRRCRDTFVRLMKTCRKLGLSFWEYLRDRLRGRGQIPRLAEIIRQRAAEAPAARNAEAVPA